VLWRPAFFGVKPEAVLKAGAHAWGPLGEGNASLERAEPTRYLSDWAGHGLAPVDVAVTFVAGPAATGDLAARLGTRRRLVAVRGCRGLSRGSLWSNRATAPVDVDPGDGTVSMAGRVLAAQPVAEVPLSRRYLLR
jgi:urease subunit alpha